MPAARLAPTLDVLSPEPEIYCPRCKGPTPLVRPWAGWRIARIAWFAIFGVMLCVSPIMMSDYAVMIPTMMVILAGFGPIHGAASVEPTCRRCGLAFPRDELARALERFAQYRNLRPL